LAKSVITTREQGQAHDHQTTHNRVKEKAFRAASQQCSTAARQHDPAKVKSGNEQLIYWVFLVSSIVQVRTKG